MVPGGFVGSALDAAKLILSSYVRALATTTPPRPTTPQAAVATHSGEKLTAGNPGRIFLVQQNSLKFDKVLLMPFQKADKKLMFLNRQ